MPQTELSSEEGIINASGYYVSGKMRLVLVSFALILVVLNIILVMQNRDLKASLNARVGRPDDLKPGTAVPALEGTDLNGNAVIISYGVDRRKTVLLSFSPQCDFCEKNMPNWEAIIKGVDKNTFRVVGISLIAAGTKEYISRHNFADTLLMTDIRVENRKAYKFHSTPQTVLIDASGKVEKVWTGLIRGEMRKEIEQALGVRLPAESEVAETLRQKRLTNLL